jgi:hypothetical protein
MDIIRLYQDYSVDFLTEGHKHTRPGWANTECPFCTGNPGYHLGYNLQEDYYYCWRCGWHPTVETISKLIPLSLHEARAVVRQYGLLVSHVTLRNAGKKQAPTKPHQLPTGTFPLEKMHRRYLEGRGFDSYELERVWHIMGTGPVSTLDGIDYKYRVIAPVLWNGEEVSFQGRDITNKHALRYIACPKDRELIHHKNILYGKQEAWGMGETGICVEGITDVWRFGPRAFCTFGIKYTATQLRVIAQMFKRVAVVFDDDPQAIVQAKQLVADLRFRGVAAYRIPVEGDPGAMRQEDADRLVSQIV